jgi:hypothetical protein
VFMLKLPLFALPVWQSEQRSSRIFATEGKSALRAGSARHKVRSERRRWSCVRMDVMGGRERWREAGSRRKER